MTIQETVEECMGVEPGAYTMSYHDEDGDLIVLGCDEEMKDALKFSKRRTTMYSRLTLNSGICAPYKREPRIQLAALVDFSASAATGR
ncbi:NLP7-like protein [Tanacetum coccineum]